MNEQHKIRVGISQGDMNGVGPEVIIKTFMDPAICELCTPVIFASQKVINIHRKTLGAEEFNFQPVRTLDELHLRRPNLFNCFDEEPNVEFGKPSPLAGRYALRCLDAAINAIMQGKIDVLVTAPVDKHSIAAEMPSFTGHTEYLFQKSGAAQVLMLLVNEGLRVGLVTGHVPLKDVSALITKDRIIAKAKLVAKSLLEDFGIRKPKIAVLGLNPHAGDAGALGKEEQEIILPAIESLRNENFLILGPYSADGFFGSGAHHKFDGILAMYHDQGLAPFKALSFSSGVNFTAGLPFVRTSPDHGTAYDLAGKNMANESSFREAVFTAMDIFRRRNNWAEISVNPLPFRMKERER